ncbi:MAG TPA: DNA gyrase C-terminal beta-propeller domain-containing protein, partial [Anaerolineaceae bacterium]|nr:DNA gyrase C-terminal beta-propeller domain-containing protein [Anaerolineaceae bacterium]
AHYLVVTRSGMAIRFEGSEVRPMGLLAAGVNAIKLSAGDEVAGMIEIARKGDVVLVASNGAGWRVEPDGFPLQGRYGQGVIGCRMADGVGLIGVVFGKKNFQYTLHLKKAAAKTCRVDDIGYTKRAGKSEQILQLASGDRVERIVRMMDSAE